jgi:hypothetical protein
MARPLRIELPGGLYHVTSRADRREDFYFSDAGDLGFDQYGPTAGIHAV